MRRRGARLTAVITGRAREVGPVEAHERNVLAITRRIHRKEARLRTIAREQKRLRAELRNDRRELRAVLQRKSEIPAAALEAGGRADAVDAVNAHLEQGGGR